MRRITNHYRSKRLPCQRAKLHGRQKNGQRRLPHTARTAVERGARCRASRGHAAKNRDPLCVATGRRRQRVVHEGVSKARRVAGATAATRFGGIRPIVISVNNEIMFRHKPPTKIGYRHAKEKLFLASRGDDATSTGLSPRRGRHQQRWLAGKVTTTNARSETDVMPDDDARRLSPPSVGTSPRSRFTSACVRWSSRPARPVAATRPSGSRRQPSDPHAATRAPPPHSAG